MHSPRGGVMKPRRTWRSPEERARARALRDWRGIDLEPLEVARKHSEKPASEIVSKLMEDMKLDRRRADAEIVKVWNHMVDPNITAHAQPVKLHNGTLFVDVDNSVWLDEIVRYRRHDILRRLQSSFGSEQIRRISFRIG